MHKSCPPKKTKIKLGLKNLAMLPNYFSLYFVRLRQKVRLRPEVSPKFLSTLGRNPDGNRSEKPGSTYDSASYVATFGEKWTAPT